MQNPVGPLAFDLKRLDGRSQPVQGQVPFGIRHKFRGAQGGNLPQHGLHRPGIGRRFHRLADYPPPVVGFLNFHLQSSLPHPELLHVRHHQRENPLLPPGVEVLVERLGQLVLHHQQLFTGLRLANPRVDPARNRGFAPDFHRQLPLRSGDGEDSARLTQSKSLQVGLGAGFPGKRLHLFHKLHFGK